MLVIIERFGETYTFEVPEEIDEFGNKISNICLADATLAIDNLLRGVFPEMVTHRLELVCEHDEEDEDCDGDCFESEGDKDNKGEDENTDENKGTQQNPGIDIN